MKVSPLLFPYSYCHNGLIVKHTNTFEVCQGGPLVGTLSVDGRSVSECYFGGPIAFEGDFLFGPGYFKRQFYLSAVHLPTRSVRLLQPESLVLIKEVRSSIISYYTDLENTCEKIYHFTPSYRI